MTWMWLMCLCTVYFNHRILGMTTYNGSTGQLERNTTFTNLLLNISEENSQEIQQRNQTAPGYKLQTSSKASVVNIPYVTNNTAGSSKNGQITGRRSVAIPMAKSQRFQSGFRPSDRVYNPPGRTHNSRTATKPTFETSRGKNWCAYVHTRLSPTVVIDSTHVPIVTDPCYWSREGCHKRYQMMSRPTYKIKHKISTSLEWRCCPGYVGPQCQPKVESATQIHQSDRKAEVHSDEKAAEGTAPEESQQATQPGIRSKMDYEDMNQEKEISFFWKKVNGISMDIDTMKKILSSLEEKVNEKGDDLPSVMKALKTKAIQDTLREIVQEEMKSFQSIIQESISKILKDLSTVSEENEAINISLKQLNETIITLEESQSPIKAINKHMVNDIQNMKDQLDSVQKDISIIQINITNELNDNDNSLKDKLALERQDGRIFANTLNHTLSQSREIHGQPLEGESITGPTVPDNKLNETHNLTEQVVLLGDAVRHQALVNLQLQQDMLMQERRIQNFTYSIGQQRQVEEASVALLQQCKQDLLQQMLDIKDSIRIVNQTLSDKVEPLDDMMTAIEEKMSHVSYELEELKPIKEHNGFADVRQQEEHAANLSAVEAQVDGLAVAINIFNLSISNLQKAQKDLGNQMKDKEEEVERKLNVCQDGIEDALNDTMTVINKAIDSVNDNRYVLENKLEKTNQQLDEIYDFTRKMQNSNLIQHIHFLNSTVFALQQKIENFDDLSLFDRLLESTKDSNAITKPENLTYLPQEMKKALSKLEEQQSIIDSLQGSQRNYSTDLQEQKLLLEHMESRINSLNYTLMPAAKPKKKVPVEMGLAWKYKDLNRRVQELTFIMFNLTEQVLWLKDSNQNNENLFRNVSKLIEQKVSSPLIAHQHINFTLLQKKLNDLVKRESLDLCESFLLDPTAYLNCILAGIFQDILGLQRYAKELDEWLDGSNTQNGSSVSSGRSLRNTDNIVARESRGCKLSPCANGGTCIDTQSGYVCACRSPFGGSNCTVKLVDNSASQDFSKGSYRYAPMVTFFVAHTYGMSTPGPIRFNHMYVNYGTSYSPGSGKFNIPYLGVYVFKYTIEYTSPGISGYLVEDGVDKLAFRSGESTGLNGGSKIINGDAVLELNYGQQVWLRLETGSIPVRFPPVTTFGGYLLYRT